VDARDVRDALRFTVARGIRVRARSGGHSYAGYSTLSDGVVLDLRRLNWVNVDQQSRLATIGAGNQLIGVSSALARKGATLPAGSCPSVGIAGVTLGGGFGLAGRHLGLTLDSLFAVRMVTADGELRTVDEHTDPDLFWALRGGGGATSGLSPTSSSGYIRCPRPRPISTSSGRGRLRKKRSRPGRPGRRTRLTR
jgi:FAD/FMN-containing dehydrogenase